MTLKVEVILPCHGLSMCSWARYLVLQLNNTPQRAVGISVCGRSLRNVAMKKIKATDSIFLKPFQTPKILVKSLLMGISSRMTLLEKMWAGKGGCGVSSGGGS